MDVGAVRIAEDSDFKRIKDMCLGNDETFNTNGNSQKSDANQSPQSNGSVTNGNAAGQWKLEHNTADLSVWVKIDKSVSDLYCIRAKSVFNNVPLANLFDVIMDPNYRKTWDTMMIESYELCHLSPNCDIGYYSARCPPPITNRDFVLLRSFLDLRKEIYVVSYSVNHKKLPPKKGLIRGLSYITAFYAVANEQNTGCTLYYVAQSDPKGKLPSWFVNKAATFFAPRFVRKLQKCCLKYPEWKKKNDPKSKPWLFPEQITSPRLDPNDVLPIDTLLGASSVNEENAQEDATAAQEFSSADNSDD